MLESDEAPADADTTGALSLTGIPQIDDLLQRLGDVSLSREVTAYVYANMKPRPGAKANVKRAVYVAFAPGYEFTYTLKDEDITALGRALRGECGPWSAKTNMVKVETEAWMFFNRFMLNPNHYGHPGSFATVLKYASATTSPLWYPTGSKCRLGGDYYGKDECSPSLQAKRDKTRYGEIPKQYLKVAQRLAEGVLAAPEKIYVDVGNINLKGIERYGDNVGGAGDYFLTIEKYREFRPQASTQYKIGMVAMTGIKMVYPGDAGGVFDPKGKLYEYVVANLIGVDRAQRGANIDKMSVYAKASRDAQVEVAGNNQMAASVAQMGVEEQAIDVELSTEMASISTSSDGFQTGADDIWNG